MGVIFTVERAMEHEDLVERSYVSAEVEFEFTESTFEKTTPIDFEIKKLVKKEKPEVENVNLRDARRNERKKLF